MDRPSTITCLRMSTLHTQGPTHATRYNTVFLCDNDIYFILQLYQASQVSDLKKVMHEQYFEI